MPASSKHNYSKTLAFPDTYYELIIKLLQSVELFCAYRKKPDFSRKIKTFFNRRNLFFGTRVNHLGSSRTTA